MKNESSLISVLRLTVIKSRPSPNTPETAQESAEEHTHRIFPPLKVYPDFSPETESNYISRQLVDRLRGIQDAQELHLVRISWTYGTSSQDIHTSHLQVETHLGCDLVLGNVAHPSTTPSMVPNYQFRGMRITENSGRGIQLDKLNHQSYLESVAANNNVQLMNERSTHDFASLLRAVHHYKASLAGQTLDRRRTVETPGSCSSRESTPSTCSDTWSGAGSLQDMRSTMNLFEELSSPIMWSSALSQRAASLESSSTCGSWELVDIANSNVKSPSTPSSTKHQAGGGSR